jgi:hypothetical protein
LWLSSVIKKKCVFDLKINDYNILSKKFLKDNAEKNFHIFIFDDSPHDIYKKKENINKCIPKEKLKNSIYEKSYVDSSSFEPTTKNKISKDSIKYIVERRLKL